MEEEYLFDEVREQIWYRPKDHNRFNVYILVDMNFEVVRIEERPLLFPSIDAAMQWHSKFGDQNNAYLFMSIAHYERIKEKM